MWTGRKLPLTLAFAALVSLAVGVSCRGFFVKPTLTAIGITPATPTITDGTTNNTKQFAAVGTFDDGSHGSTSVSWSSSSTTVASISSTGLATGAAVGTTTITATSTIIPTISGTTTLTVVPGNVTAITVTPQSQSTSTAAGFTLIAKDQAGNDISSSVTWTFSVGGTTETGITGTAGSSGEVFTIGTLNPPQTPTYVLNATASITISGTTTTSNTVTITVTS